MQLVTLPYSSLVNEGTRQSLGVDLTGSVVIFDEAHNLVDAINANHSASLTLSKVTDLPVRCDFSGRRMQAPIEPHPLLFLSSFAVSAGVRDTIRLPGPISEHVERGKRCTIGESSALDGCIVAIHADVGGRLMSDFTLLEWLLKVAVERQPMFQKQRFSDVVEIAEHTRKHTSVISLNDFLFRAGIPDIDTFQVLRFMQRKQLVRKVRSEILLVCLVFPHHPSLLL